MFLMDYPGQSRLKILGHAKVHEGDAEARKLIEALRVPRENAPAERALVIHRGVRLELSAAHYPALQ